MNTLVVSYSKSGNNRFLAEKIADALRARRIELKPRFSGLLPLLVSTGLKKGSRLQPLDVHPADYDLVILTGPIWMGQLVSPIRGFLEGNSAVIKKLVFATCCGGGETERDSQYGYNGVFAKVREIVGDRLAATEAFPISLAQKSKTLTSDEAMKIRLSDDNFTGALKERFDAFIEKVKTLQ